MAENLLYLAVFICFLFIVVMPFKKRKTSQPEPGVDPCECKGIVGDCGLCDGSCSSIRNPRTKVRNGHSFYICFGENGGISLERDPGKVFRICLGRISFGWIHLDLESMIEAGSDAITKLDELNHQKEK